jgi:phosphatidylserine decarboxylase
LSALSDRLKSWPLYILPHHFCSRLVFRLTRINSSMAAPAIRLFCRVFNVDMSEAANSDPASYPNFNAFFTRPLADGMRPLATDDNALCSPVDGRVSEAGEIDGERIFQAKGHDYSLLQLIGGRAEDARAFEDGKFATLYLSPRDYHRIHMPLGGRLLAMHYVPGRLFSVAPHTVRVVPGLFARNERVVAIFETDAGKIAMVLVGAINVAAIETVWAGLITPPNGREAVHRDYRDDAPTLATGEEMGRFNMGSTVILLAEKNATWCDDLKAGRPLQMGQLIGHFTGKGD